MIRSTTVLLTLVILSAHCTPGRAGIDQQYIPPSATSGYQLAAGASASDDSAQTFTVGITGLLGMVAVDVSRLSSTSAGDLLIDVRETTFSGNPVESNSSVLASGVLSAATISHGSEAFYTFDFSANPVPVVAGEQLAIVLRAGSSSASYAWYGGYGKDATYSGGEYFDRSLQPTVGTWTGDSNIDLGFKTYVTAVPEPSGIHMLAVGILALVGYAARCRNRSASARLA